MHLIFSDVWARARVESLGLFQRVNGIFGKGKPSPASKNGVLRCLSSIIFPQVLSPGLRIRLVAYITKGVAKVEPGRHVYTRRFLGGGIAKVEVG